MNNLDKHLLELSKGPRVRIELMCYELGSMIAKSVKNYRQERNWNQKDLAEKLSTTQSRISQIEDPFYCKYNLQSLVEIADVFDLDIELSFKERSTTASSTFSGSFWNPEEHDVLVEMADYQSKRQQASMFEFTDADLDSIVVSQAAQTEEAKIRPLVA